MSNFKWKIFSYFVAFSEYPNFNREETVFLVPRSFLRDHNAWQLKKIEEDKSGWLAFLIQKILGTYFVSSSQGLHGDVELMNGFADDL